MLLAKSRLSAIIAPSTYSAMPVSWPSSTPGVREVAVFGVSDAKRGETLIAAVVLRTPGAATAEELNDWVNARLGAKFQRVTDVVIVDEFPRNVAGKMLKRVLQEEYRRR